MSNKSINSDKTQDSAGIRESAMSTVSLAHSPQTTAERPVSPLQALADGNKQSMLMTLKTSSTTGKEVRAGNHPSLDLNMGSTRSQSSLDIGNSLAYPSQGQSREYSRSRTLLMQCLFKYVIPEIAFYTANMMRSESLNEEQNGKAGSENLNKSQRTNKRMLSQRLPLLEPSLPHLHAPKLSSLDHDDLLSINLFTSGQNITIVQHDRYAPRCLHYHDYFELIYVLQGEFIHTVATQQMYLRTGDICIIPPKVYHSLEVDNSSVILNVLISHQLFTQLCLQNFNQDSMLRRLAQRHYLQGLPPAGQSLPPKPPLASETQSHKHTESAPQASVAGAKEIAGEAVTPRTEKGVAEEAKAEASVETNAAGSTAQSSESNFLKLPVPDKPCFDYLYFPALGHAAVENTILSMCQEILFPQKYTDFALQTLLSQLLLYLERDLNAQAIEADNTHPVDTLSLQIRQYVDNHFTTITLDSLAADFGYTKTYMSAIAKKALGNNFISYVINKKLDLAAYLLSTTKHNVHMIAAHVGYAKDESTFSRIFKKHYGLSPLEYRQRNSIVQ